MGRPEAALLAAVDDLIRDHRLTESGRAGPEEHFDTAQILDIIAIDGMYVILGCMIRSWGLDLDSDVAARIAEPPTRAVLTPPRLFFMQEIRADGPRASLPCPETSLTLM